VEMRGFAGAIDAHEPHLLPALHLKDTSWICPLATHPTGWSTRHCSTASCWTKTGFSCGGVIGDERRSPLGYAPF
jgi:hypothetical protein